jgi:phospholipase C
MASRPEPRQRRTLLVVGAIGAVLVVVGVGFGVSLAARPTATTPATAAPGADRSATTTTPIKHVVVIYDENVSYDHYFATYPHAANTDGVPFTSAPGTPANDNLVSADLLTKNPNLYPPTRLTPSQASTCDQNHGYTAEQRAVHRGLMDRFVQNTSVDTCTGLFGAPGLAMDYFDGNTVTALWNYAQHYAMSDNSWDATFGPSTLGALNLISGQTHGFTAVDSRTGKRATAGFDAILADTNAEGVGTVISDADPAYDDCSDSSHTSTNTLLSATGANIGDLLNARGVTWGWFQGGFRPTTPAGSGASYAVCGAAHKNIAGASVADYSAHHNPFAYYRSTSNPHHLPPTSPAMIGRTDRANHNYDLSDFRSAITSGHLPAVSFLKAPAYQDGHAGYSDPIDEQHFLVDQINLIENSADWPSTAIVVAYDDSDGWYDHAPPTITNSSHSAAHDVGTCTGAKAPTLNGYADRCGPGQRLPMLILSPYARANYVAHDVVSQPSILTFIEHNWSTGTIGHGSFDGTAGSIESMFDFRATKGATVILNQNGSVATVRSVGH